MADITTISPDNEYRNAEIGIVISRFNRDIGERLLQACIGKLIAAGIKEENILLVEVPGAFEIPVAAQRLINNRSCAAVITLGAIIRGETPHFEYIASSCTQGIAGLSIQHDIPVIFGVLTVDTMEQALERSGEAESNKGADCAAAALDMISVMRKI